MSKQPTHITSACDTASCCCASIHHFKRINTAALTDDELQFADDVFERFSATPTKFSNPKLRYLADWSVQREPSIYAAGGLSAVHQEQARLRFFLSRTDDTLAPVKYCACELNAYQADYIERANNRIIALAAEIAREEGRLQ